MHRLPREAYNSFHGNIAPVSGPDAVGSPRRLSLSFFLSFLFCLLFHLCLLLVFHRSSRPPPLSTADSLPAINPSATIRGSNCIINCVCPCTSRGPHSAARCTRHGRVESGASKMPSGQSYRKSNGSRSNTEIVRVSRPKNTDERFQMKEREKESHGVSAILN